METGGRTIMFEGHDPFLVALSVAIAILGGYTGFALAARVRGAAGVSRRVLLAGAAGFLAVGIWTMHFVGMLAAPIPSDAVYLVLPTIISFLICALVVGISLFFVSIGEPSLPRVVSSAVLLGVGISGMHYVGIHSLAGHFTIEHDPAIVALSVLVAIVTAYGGLCAFLARQDGIRLIASSIAFGLAVSGMHYTAMSGMHLLPLAAAQHHAGGGLAASPQTLSVVVAVLCFVIAAGFLLSLVPDPRRQGLAGSDRGGEPGREWQGHGHRGRLHHRQCAHDLGCQRREGAGVLHGSELRGHCSAGARAEVVQRDVLDAGYFPDHGPEHGGVSAHGGPDRDAGGGQAGGYYSAGRQSAGEYLPDAED